MSTNSRLLCLAHKYGLRWTKNSWTVSSLPTGYPWMGFLGFFLKGGVVTQLGFDGPGCLGLFLTDELILCWALMGWAPRLLFNGGVGG